ncbi:MAG: hypothetical protein ISS78_06355 [Phycisphaerae bacterium]|nr:hypothetical protein [Phycisphaerae bacterium]
MLTLEQFKFLRTPLGRELLAMDLPVDDPLAAQAALRKRCGPAEAAAVAEMRRVRRRAGASGKFPPEFAAGLLAGDVMVQQASSFRLAAYVGRQLADLAGDGEVLDLCSGLGADAIGAARSGAAVRGVDSDAGAVFCAAHNADLAGVADRCSFARADTTAMDLPAGAVVHIDPDRRATGRRTVLMEDYSPPAEFLRDLTTRARAGAMKLSPALDRGAVDHWGDTQIEYVSEGRVCKQLVVWWGARRAGRKATVLAGATDAPHATSIDVDPAALAEIADPTEWLIEPDPAVIAAAAVDTLAAAHNLHRTCPTLAWLFGHEPADTPLGRNYHILARVPGRESDVRRAMRKLSAARVTVKPRGLKLNTDKLQRRLSSRKGTRDLVVLWCKLARREEAYIAEAGR